MATTTKIEFGDRRVPRRFWDKVRKSSNGCWHWTGGLSEQRYGQCSPPPGESRVAHRYLYSRLVEPLPHRRGHPGYRDVDHECHNRSKSCPGGKACMHRRCVNPAHLAAKTQQENLAASPHVSAAKRMRTHCKKRGHLLTVDNIYVAPNGSRACRDCMRINALRRHSLKGGRVYTIKEQCKSGHDMVGDNLYVSPKGTRHCRTCRAAALQRQKAKVRALAH